eukprot:scaffold56397_cov15-Tisochrysis_lutea.AAC.1
MVLAYEFTCSRQGCLLPISFCLLWLETSHVVISPSVTCQLNPGASTDRNLLMFEGEHHSV